MEFILFRREEYDRFYNCSILREDEWEAYTRPNLWFGTFSLITGCFYLILYIPCLTVMLKRELIRHSCYKLMFYLGILDCLSIVTSCLVTGYLAIDGRFPCPHYRDFEYVLTTFACGIWCSVCVTCIILAFNRCIDLWRNKHLLALFYHHRTYYWIGLCVLYLTLVTIYVKGLFFSPVAYAWFFDPFFGMTNLDVDRTEFFSVVHSVNNIGVIVVLSLLNTFLVASIYWKTRKSNSNYLSLIQRRITAQTVLICSINFFAAFVYVYMQFFPTPAFLIMSAHIMWQLSSGLTPIVYLSLNLTIRQSVIDLIYPNFLKPFHKLVSSNVSLTQLEGRASETTPIFPAFSLQE